MDTVHDIDYMYAMFPRARGLVSVLLFSAATVFGQEFEIVRQFLYAGGYPAARMLAASDGNMYGTAYYGGDFNLGSIFRLTPDGSGGFTYQLLYSFRGVEGAYPLELIQAADSKLYGVAAGGGAQGGGTAFVFEPPDRLVVLHDFAATDYPAPTLSPLLQATDGQFYGVYFHGGAFNHGMFFRMSPSGDFSVLHDFQGPEGREPVGALLQASDGYLYGVGDYGGANGGGSPRLNPDAVGSPNQPAGRMPEGGGGPTGGTIFRADFLGNVIPIHSFSFSEGSLPNGALVEGFDGNLYGTAYDGGPADNGVVFRCDKSGNLAVLAGFPSPEGGTFPNTGLTRGADGSFFGVTAGGNPPSPGGTVFRITEDAVFSNVASFPGGDPTNLNWPIAAVAFAADGSLFGTTSHGGISDAGTIFRIPLPATRFSVVHQLGYSVPLYPRGELIETTDGTLWGTGGGGSFGLGSVFHLSGGPLLVHDFSAVDGEGPKNLWEATDGNLYGTTSHQGPNGAGTVYRLDPSSGTFTTLHGFAGSDGSDPENTVVQAADGNLYGTTWLGGAAAAGTVFRIDTSGNFTKLYDLADLTDQPSFPVGRLLPASDGNLYGTSTEGGDGFRGTIFRIDSLGNLTKIHSFLDNDSGGQSPFAGLVQAADGNFYGTTPYTFAPDNGVGTIFRIDASGTFATIHNFENEGQPRVPLLQASDGRLYGTTSYAQSYSSASIFRVDTSGQNFETVYEGGTAVLGGLLEAPDGMLYGTSTNGGWTGTGLIYRLDLANSPPAISAVSPASGRAAGGVSMAIDGDHFRDGATTNLGPSPIFDTHTLFAVSPAFSPGSLNDVTVTNADGQSATASGAFFADFLDAPSNDQFHAEIETIFRNGITAGCGGGNYCTDAPASRAQMAVLLLKVEHGAAYAPPQCTGVFSDVACPSLFAAWIEQFAAEDLTAGCGGGNYCPQDPVKRDQLAVLILKYEHDPAYVPPPCAGIFLDVACPSLFADWIEEFAAEKITVGCGNGNYCPELPTTRGQMAVFLTRALAFP